MDVLVPVLITATGAMIAFNGAVIGNKLSEMGSTIKAAIGLFKSLTTQTVLTAGEMKLFNSITSIGTVGAIGAVVGVIGLAVTAYQSYQMAQKEARKNAIASSKAILEEADSLKEIKEQYENIYDSTSDATKREEKLIGIKKKLVEQYGLEEEALKGINTERKTGLFLISEEIKKNATKALGEIAEEYKEASKKLNEAGSEAVGEVTFLSEDDLAELSKRVEGFYTETTSAGYTYGFIEYDSEIEKMERFQQASDVMNEILGRSVDSVGNYNITVNGLAKEIDEVLGASAEDYADRMELLSQRTQIAIQQNSDLVDSYLAGKISLDELKDGITDTIVEDDALTESIVNNIDAWVASVDATDDAETASKKLSKLLSEELTKDIDELKNKLSSASSAMSDFSDYGGLTEGTLSSLEEAFPGVINGLHNADGSMNQAGITALSTAGSVGKLVDALEILSKIGNAQADLDEALETNSMAIIMPAMSKLSELKYELEQLLESDEYTTPAPNTHKEKPLDKTDPIEEQSKIFSDEISALENQLSLMEKQGKTAEELIEKRKEIQKRLNEQANWFRGKGVKEGSPYLVDLSLQWFDQQQDIDEGREEIANRRNVRLSGQSDIFDKDIESLEYELYLMEQRGSAKSELIVQEKKIQEALHNQAEWFRAEGENEESEYIKDRTKQWYKYYRDIKDKEQELADEKEAIRQEELANEEEARQEELANEEEARQEALDKSQDMIDRYNEYVEAKREEQLEKYKDGLADLEKSKSNMETAFEYLEKIIGKEIDLVEDEMDAVNDAYDEKINALNDENDAIEEQISLEEKLEALAKAKSTKKLVYKDGQFSYTSDYDAISGAQSDLDQYNREQELEEQKNALEESREKELAVLQAKIDGWNDYLDTYSGIVDDYNTEQDRLIAEQVLGTELEKDNWDKRLSNALNFAKEYNEIMKGINDKNDEIDAFDKSTDDSDIVSPPTKDEIIAQMKANSDAWFGADEETKKELHEANEQLNAMLGGDNSDFNSSTGKWNDVIATGKSSGLYNPPVISNASPIPMASSASQSYVNKSNSNIYNYNINAPITATSEEDATSWVSGITTIASSESTSRI